MNEKFQNALQRKEQKVPPIWLMRQAGRYQKTYRALREKHSFIDLCKKPELSSLVGLNAVKEFDFDVAILFSDLLFPLEAFGMGLDYKPGPILGWQLESKDDFKKYASTDEAFEKMKFQGECTKATREVLPKDKSLIGFVGGFWTLFGYAVDGSHKGGLTESKKKIELFEEFSDHLLKLLLRNIQLQLDNGAEVVMVFDTAVGEVSAEFYKTNIVPKLKTLVEAFPNKLGYYSKATCGSYFDDEFFNLKWAGTGWDHRWDLSEVIKNYKHNGFIQGNFDQSYIHQESELFKKTLESYLHQYDHISDADLRGWVAGLGHGVLPKTPEDNVKYYVNRLREYFESRG